MKAIDVIALILILIGAINWGLWGVAQFDFIAWLFGGDSSWFARLIYTLVGLAGLWGLKFLSKLKTLCCSASCSPKEKQ